MLPTSMPAATTPYSSIPPLPPGAPTAQPPPPDSVPPPSVDKVRKIGFKFIIELFSNDLSYNFIRAVLKLAKERRKMAEKKKPKSKKLEKAKQ